AVGSDEWISDVLLNVDVVRRHRVRWHECIEATQGRLGWGMQYRTVRRSTGHDNGPDAAILQYFLKVGVEKLVGSGLNEWLFAIRGYIGNRVSNATTDNAVDDKNVVCACVGQQLLGGGQRRRAARSDFLVTVLLDKIEHQ